jgi:hypothetical protein
MPYYTGDFIGYRGDYYRGDYYRGDPGLFSFLGKALGGVVKLGGGVVKSALGLSAPTTVTSFLPTYAPAPPAQNIRYLPGVSGPQRGLINIGGSGAQTGLINVGGTNGGGGMPVMRGYHLNRSKYETRGGGTSRWPQELELHEKGTVLVRNRRMNVGNARALRHSLHRISGFARLARRVMSFTHPGHGKGRFKFHRKRKRA